MLYGLDLFSGIGGIALALKDWIRPIAYCEIDPYCRGILLSRMAGKLLPSAPIWDDVRSFPFQDISSGVDIISGGFPCQDISIAGNGKGLDGERSGLFFEILRISQEIKPHFIFLENVPAITSRGGLHIVKQIAEMGYDCRWCIISASKYVDQRRERWFLLAKSRSMRCEERTDKRIQPQRQASFNEEFSYYKLQNMENWASFANSMRTDNGLSRKVDRIRALGNAVVPAQAKEAFELLMGIKK